MPDPVANQLYLADEADKREVPTAAGKEKAELFDCPLLEVSAKTGKLSFWNLRSRLINLNISLLGQNIDLSFVELLKILEKER